MILVETTGYIQVHLRRDKWQMDMLHDKQTIITVDNQQKINSVNKWICWVFSWQTSTLRFLENPELAMYFQIHFPVTLRRGIVATLWCNIDLLDIAAIINTSTRTLKNSWFYPWCHCQNWKIKVKMLVCHNQAIDLLFYIKKTSQQPGWFLCKLKAFFSRKCKCPIFWQPNVV